MTSLQCHVRIERDQCGGLETHSRIRARGLRVAFLERNVVGSLLLRRIHISSSLRFIEHHRQTIR
jgi:hypothetical protein